MRGRHCAVYRNRGRHVPPIGDVLATGSTKGTCMMFSRQLRRCRGFAALTAALLALGLPAASSAAGVDVDGDQVAAPGSPADWQTLVESGAVAAQLEPSPDDVI